MEWYVEYKPCYETIRDRNGNPEYGHVIIPPIIRFVDGKSNCCMHITKDFKFVYGFYCGQITMFRVTNISSKPIEWKCDRLARYKSIQKQIDKLKQEQRRIVRGGNVLWKN